MIRQYYSWTINGDLAIKDIDKSVIHYNGVAIPHQIKYFWHLDDMVNGDKRFLTLVFNKNNYKARLEMSHGSVRLFWHSDLKKAAGLEFSEEQLNIVKPKMFFQKLEDGKYGIKIITHGEDSGELVIPLDNVTCCIEGGQRVYYTTRYERNARCREQAIKIHGCKCLVCGFDFQDIYGEIGKGYIEIHHRNPLFSLDAEVEVHPETDLAPVCSNCHRMLHRRRDRIITIEELQTCFFPHH